MDIIGASTSAGYIWSELGLDGTGHSAAAGAAAVGRNN